MRVAWVRICNNIIAPRSDIFHGNELEHHDEWTSVSIELVNSCWRELRNGVAKKSVDVSTPWPRQPDVVRLLQPRFRSFENTFIETENSASTFQSLSLPEINRFVHSTRSPASWHCESQLRRREKYRRFEFMICVRCSRNTGCFRVGFHSFSAMTQTFIVDELKVENRKRHVKCVHLKKTRSFHRNGSASIDRYSLHNASGSRLGDHEPSSSFFLFCF